MTDRALPTARDIMNARLHTVRGDAPLESAIHELLARGYSGAPVVDADGALQGVLSEHDCIRVLALVAAEAWPPGHVEDHMTRAVETVRPNEDVLALAGRFSSGAHRRLLVVEDGRLVGMITRRDLLRALEELIRRRGRGRPKTTYEVLQEQRG